MSASQTIAALTMEQIAESMEEVYASLVVEQHNAQLPEPILVSHFLPWLLGEVHPSKANPIMTDWISIAGSVTNAVDIIDQGGNVLITIPGILNTTIIDPVGRDVGNSIADIQAQYSLRSQGGLPIVATNYIAGALDDKAGSIQTESTDTISSKQWDALFTRYGKVPVSTKVQLVDTDTSDDLDYDQTSS